MLLNVSIGFNELTFEEMILVDGGVKVKWGQVLEGVAYFGATMLAISSAPVTVPVGVIALAGLSGTAFAGYTVGKAIKFR
ncbi:hypothetical protein [Anoxybacillus ayderensis]|nr:hypothetical protein [Anoxybacillus ayderensis]